MKKTTVTILAAIGVHGSLSAEQKHDIVQAGYQAAPGAGAAAGARVFGLPLSDMLVLASILFVALQAAYLVWKWRRDARREQDRQDDRRRGVPVDSCDTESGALG